jgi:hypothetical protein
MRVRVTNEGRREGSLLIDDGYPDDDRPPRLKKLPAGKSVDVRITQRGHLTVVGFKARVVPVARNRKPETAKAKRVKEVRTSGSRRQRPSDRSDRARSGRPGCAEAV